MTVIDCVQNHFIFETGPEAISLAICYKSHIL